MFHLRPLVLAITTASLSLARAQWDPNIAESIGFGDEGLTERSIHVCNDVHGNVFCVARYSSTLGLQRWDSLGFRTWDVGIIVPNAGVVNRDHILAPDEQGGCYLAYVLNTGTIGLYVQHLDSAGTPLLPWPGQRVITPGGSFWADVWMERDSTHLYISFSREDNDGFNKVFAQKMDLDLQRAWGDNGIIVSPPAADHLNARCLADGEGGMVLLYRSAPGGSNSYMRMQHLDSTGTGLWGVGTALHDTIPVGNFGRPELRRGAFGDHYACWDGGISTVNTGVYLAHVDSAGTSTWGSGPVVVADGANVQDLPTMQVDTQGNAVLAWRDMSTFPYLSVFAQKVDTAGVLQWNVPVTVDDDGLNYCFPRLIPEGEGMRIFWTANSNFGPRVLTQLIDATGTKQCALPGDTVGYFNLRNTIDDQVLRMPQGGYLLPIAPTNFTGGAYLQYTLPSCELTTAMPEAISTDVFRIWPVPAEEVVTITLPDRVQRVNLLDAQGRTVLTSTANGRTRLDLDLSSLPSGPYMVLGDGRYLGRCIRL